MDLRAKYTGKGNVLPEDPFARGRQLYAQCALCHGETGPSIGPSLLNILESKIANDANFSNYSTALKDYAKENVRWDESLIDQFLQSPKGAIPGTYMGYDGLENAKDRQALITYIKERNIVHN